MDHNSYLFTPPRLDWSAIDYGDKGKDEVYSDLSLPCYEPAPEPAPLNFATPPRTPNIHCGPRLIPKVREQDKVAEPLAVHSRTSSQGSWSSTGFPSSFNHHMAGFDTSQGLTSPAIAQLATPLSNGSSPMSMPWNSPIPALGGRPCSSMATSIAGTTPPRPAIGHGRSFSSPALPSRTRARNLSNASIDGNVLHRYGYPTYKSVPQNTPSGTRPRTASALSHLTPLPMLDPPMSSVANIPRQLPASASHQTESTTNFSAHPLSFDLSSTSMACTSVSFPDHSAPTLNAIEQPTKSTLHYKVEYTTLRAYLTSPSPSPSLVRRVHEPARSLYPWFDVRNLRSWTTFSTKTISTIRALLPLLNCPIPSTDLPTVRPSTTDPETHADLHKLLSDHFCVKVNAALKIALGESALQMRSLHPTASAPTSRQNINPEFIANYSDDTETVFQEQHNPYSTPVQRGRVIGLVKCYEQWNSGMRNEDSNKQVRYLAGLAHLHTCMRRHGCRYGYLLTEIELVCVRYGGDGGAAVPNFGFLEISEAVRLSAHTGAHEDGEEEGLRMTAAIALFFLHMMAKRESLPGEWSWKLDIGAPAALTRKKHLKDRDPWMPQITTVDKREARRTRGWVFPDEDLCRKERSAGRRRK